MRSILGRALALVAWTALALAGAAIAAVLAFAFVLSERPVDVTGAARWLVGSAPGAAALPLEGGSLALSHASLAWPRDGRDRGDFVLAIDGLKWRDAGGRVRDRVGSMHASFEPATLFRLRFAPARLEARDGRIALSRRPGGSIGLAGGAAAPIGLAGATAARIGLAGAAAARTTEAGAAAPTTEAGTAAPTTRTGPGIETVLAALPRLSLDRFEVSLAAGDGLPAVSLDALSLGGGPGPGDGRIGLRAQLALGRSRAPLAVSLDGPPDRRVVRATIAGFDPSAGGIGALAGMFEGAVDASLVGRLDASGRLAELDAQASSGAATLRAAGEAVAVRSSSVRLSWHPDPAREAGGRAGTLALDALRAEILSDGGRTVVIAASGGLSGGFGPGGRLAGRVRVDSSTLDLATLDRLWPEGVATDARRWVSANLRDGLLEDGSASFGLASGDGASGLRLDGVRAHVAVDGASLTWLAPIEPARGMHASVDLLGPDELVIRATAGHMHGLDVAGTSMRITGLTGAVQLGTIEAHLAGSVADLVWVLRQKRLHLDPGAVLSLQDPGGRFDGTIRIGLPLDDRVTMAGISIVADASLRGLSLADVAFGRRLEDGRFALHADNSGLSLTGDGRFADAPVRVDLRLDFRDLPPDRPVETARIEATLVPAAFAALVPARIAILHGRIGASVEYRLDGDGHASGSIALDLDAAGFDTAFGWDKSDASPGRASVGFALERGALVSLGPVDATAPGLRLEARAQLAPGRAREIDIARLVVGRTDASGTIALATPTRGVSVRLAGRRLDLAPLMHDLGAPAPAPPAPPSPGTPAAPTPGPAPAPVPPWQVELRFDELVLAHDARLAEVAASVTGRGGRIERGRFTAAGTGPDAAPAGTIEATLDAPDPGGTSRDLSLRASDAGALLDGLGLTDRIAGGTLALTARVDGPGWRPIAGVATLDRFTVVRTPVAVRLLRDATIYGLIDRAGRGAISVARARTRFRLDGGTLAITHARAHQAAIGLTADGTIDLDRGAVALDGTIVPAWAINALPGRLPVIGRLLSPERGGGLFAATFRLDGTLADPSLRVNPLATLVPGVLRRLLSR